MSDPREAKTLDEACSNGDGTFNGLRLLSWLSGYSVEDVKMIAEEVKKRRDEKTP